jgi:hypothetical protein
MTTYFWNPVPSKTCWLFIRSDNERAEFQRPELRGSINEEAQKSWAKTPDLNIKRTKRVELISSWFWSCKNRSNLLIREMQTKDGERRDSRYVSLKVWYGGSFTRDAEAREAKRKGLKSRKKNATPLLVEKFGTVNDKRRGSCRKIEGEMLKL